MLLNQSKYKNLWIVFVFFYNGSFYILILSNIKVVLSVVLVSIYSCLNSCDFCSNPEIYMLFKEIIVSIIYKNSLYSDKEFLYYNIIQLNVSLFFLEYTHNLLIIYPVLLGVSFIFLFLWLWAKHYYFS